MLKKLFVTAAAAAAVSVPLAGVAWATPANNEPPGQRDTPSGQPGIPGVVGEVADSIGANPNPGQAVPPGQAFKELKDGSITVNIPGGPGPSRVNDHRRQRSGTLWRFPTSRWLSG